MIESKLKSDIRQKITDGPHVTPEFRDSGVEFLSVDGIQNSQLVFKGKRFISREDHELYQLKAKVETGDILLGKAASVGKVAIVGDFTDFSIWSPLALIKPKHDLLNSKFLYYLFQSDGIEQQINDLSTFNTQQNISMGDLHELKYLRPSISKQESIVKFLDNKTGNVDLALDNLKQKLIHLEEYKTALIHNAVTKGLDANGCRILDGTPAADMNWKPSGVEWIGDVPEGWDVKSIKSVVSSFGEGGTPSTSNSDYWEGGDIPWVTVSDICEEISSTKKMITEEGLNGSSANMWPIGTVILSNAATIGSVGITKVPLCTKQGISGFIVNPDVDNYFFSQCLVNKKDRFNKMARETTFKSLNGVFLKNEVVALPLSNEQKVISSFIKTKNKYIQASNDAINKKITLLIEYKKSLINEAVSGEV